MSYTRTYTSSINVSGSVGVSYPASEHGGFMTARYDEDVPVTVNITVATEPFDQSISTAGSRVDGLTASVAAMNTANCVAIAQCSKQISDSFINGFYNLIQSDITTKKAETNTVLQTRFALLLEHSKDVQTKHDRMRSDLERERAKYNKVFKDLDAELERRITEINRPAVTLSRKARDGVVVQPYLTKAAETAEQLNEKRNNGGNVALAGLRQKVLTVLRDLSSSLHNNLTYRHMMRNILWDKSLDNEKLSYIPVAYCVYDSIENSRRVYQCYASDCPQKNAVLARVNTYIGEKCAGEARTIPEDELRLIDQAFSSMVQDNYLSIDDHSERQERIYTEICRMWKNDCANLKQV